MALCSPLYTLDQDLRTFSLVTGVMLLLLTCALVSRLCLHPLARFPGPVPAALTDYYLSYYGIFKDGELIPQLRYLHGRYGPVIRIGPNKLHFSDPIAYDDIYRDNRFPKEPWFYDAWISYTSSFGCTDIKGAKERRGLINPFFSRRSVLHLEQVIQDTVDRFIHSMHRNYVKGNVVDMHRGFLSIALEVITAYCFAERYDAIDYPAYANPFLIALVDAFKPIFIVQHFPFLRPFIFGLPRWLVKIISPQSLAFPAFTRRLEDQIDAILQDPSLLEKSEQETIYHHLLNPKSGRKLTKDGLRHEASTLVAAGTDTVGNTCNVALFYSLDNENIEKRLRRELKEAWPDVDAPMPVEKLEKLPYLARPLSQYFSLTRSTAVIHESLRFAHGVVAPLPRVVTETKCIGGHIVPRGAVIAMSQTFMHCNPNIFPDPLKFDPDRWLREDSAELLNYLVPFSRGQRQCIGMNLGWVELYLILGNLFRKVDLELVDTTVKAVGWKALLTVKFNAPVKARVKGVEGLRGDSV